MRKFDFHSHAFSAEFFEAISFPFDTTFSAPKLIQAKLFEQFPQATLVLAHLGRAAVVPRPADIFSLRFSALLRSLSQPRQRPSETTRGCTLILRSPGTAGNSNAHVNWLS